MIFLLLELLLADHLADLPLVVASSGQQWQFHIHTVRAHINRYILPFILLELISADQLVDLPPW